LLYTENKLKFDFLKLVCYCNTSLNFKLAKWDYRADSQCIIMMELILVNSRQLESSQ